MNRTTAPSMILDCGTLHFKLIRATTVCLMLALAPMAWAGSGTSDPTTQRPPCPPDTSANDHSSCPESKDPNASPHPGDVPAGGTSVTEENVAADPVILSTGEFILGRNDLTVRTNGQPFAITSFYGSQKTINSGLGYGRDSNLLARVEDTGMQALVYTVDASPVQFDKIGAAFDGPDGSSLTYSGSQYTYSQPNGLTYFFDSNGRVLSKTLRTGHVFKWIYDGTGRVTSIKDKDDTDIYRMSYDTDLITKIEDVQGSRDVVYEYSASGDMTHATSSCGGCAASPEQSYVYDNNHQLLTLKNGNGQAVFANEYSDLNRVTLQTKLGTATAATTSYDYSDYSNQHYRFVDFGGVTRDYYQDSNYNLTKVEVGKTVKGIPVQAAYTYEYDASKSLTKSTTPRGRVVGTPMASAKVRPERYVTEFAGQAITRGQYEYGDYSNITRTTDANGNKQDYFYNSSGMMLTHTVRRADNSVVLSESWDYDNFGNVLTHKDGESKILINHYDSHGYLTQRIVDPAGLNITESYLVDAAGRITQRTDPRGNIWKSYYNDAGNVTKSVDPTSQTMLYAYDADHKLITQTAQDAETSPSVTLTTAYLRDAEGNITRMVAPGNRITDYLYDGNNFETWQKAPTGEEYITLYNARDQVQQLQVYDPVAAVTVTRANYYYDGDKNLISQTDANGDSVVKLREYDGQNHVTRQVDALDNYTLYRYDDLGNLTRQLTFDSGHTAMAGVDYAYDAANRVTSERLLSSPAWTGTSNQDVVTAYIYDGVSRITKTRKTLYGDDGGETVAESISTYDAAGRLLTRTASDAPAVAYSYDAAGNVLTQKTDPAGLAITIIQQYDSVGRVTRSTQPDSTYQVSLYDAFGQVTKSIAYNTSGGRLAVTGQFYDDHLGVVTRSYQISSPGSTDTFNSTNDPYSDALYTSGGRLTKTIDPLSHATTYDYDGLGRRITTTDPIGNKVVPLYDNADRLMTQVRLDYDAPGSVTFKTAYEYDALNRVTRTIDQGPDGDITATTDNLASTQWYDALGQVTQTQYPAGQQTAYLFDKLGQLTRTTEDAGGGQNSIGRHTDRAYDRANRLTRLTAYSNSAGGTGVQNTDYAYSKAGQLTKTTYPDTGAVSLYVDAANRITRRTDPKNTSLDFAYDAMGRVLTKHEGTNLYWTFVYDALGQPTLAKKGTTAGGDQIASSTYSYDGLGRLTRHSQKIGAAAAKTSDYLYDKVNDITSMTYPGGTTIARTFTAMGQLDVISRSGSTLADFGYVGPRNRVKTLTYETGANDVLATRTYDGTGRMTRLQWSQSGNTLPDLQYAYDAASNITQLLQAHRSNQVEAYGYDTLHRLTGARYDTRTLTHGFIYDDLSNRLTFTANAATTTALFNAVNEMTKLDTTDVLYDDAGNLTKDDRGYTYHYDPDNKITLIRKTNDTVDVAKYDYDAQGRRIQFIDSVNSVTKTYYHEANQDRVLAEFDGPSTTRQRYYVWGNYIDELLVMHDETPGSDRFVCHNHLYSPLALLDSSGGIIETYEYDAYGKQTIYVNNGGDGNWWDGDETTALASAQGFVYLFTGREMDCLDNGNLLLNYHRARYYDFHRWFTRDPAEYPDGYNLYAGYFGMRGGMDPSGLQSDVFIDNAPEPTFMRTLVQYDNALARGILHFVNSVAAIPAGIVANLSTGRKTSIPQVASWLESNVTDRYYPPLGGGKIADGIERYTPLTIQLGLIFAPKVPTVNAGKSCPPTAPVRTAGSITTPYRTEVQSMSGAARTALGEAQSGAGLYRTGQLGKSMAAESQYWSLQNPLAPGYAGQMGMPRVSPNFSMGGSLNPGASVLTNQATGLGTNLGGGIQVVTSPGGVGIQWFVMPY